MKVKFNKTRSFTDRFNFDNNTTSSIGVVQPLFCHMVSPHTKFTYEFSQLMRLAPMVCPSFARLKTVNLSTFVPMSQVFPAYDAFISQTHVHGANLYVPASLPVVSNADLAAYLCLNYGYGRYFEHKSSSTVYTPIDDVSTTFTWYDILNSQIHGQDDPFLGVQHFVKANTYCPGPTLNEVPSLDSCDFVYGNLPNKPTFLLGFRLSSVGRFWYSVLRGLGYSLNSSDVTPVSVLPIYAFAKSCYDHFAPHRYLSWHSSLFYKDILATYNNPSFVTLNDVEYIVPNNIPLYGWNADNGSSDFPFFASSVDCLTSAAQTNPINQTDLFSIDGVQSSVDSSEANFNVPKTTISSASSNLQADTVSLLGRVWSFLTKSSVVGQNVRDFFKVHFDSHCDDDMFDNSTVIGSVSNVSTINSVVSTADTLSGSDGDVLGALGGSGSSLSKDKFTYSCNQFGFIIHSFVIVPISGISSGNQYELSNTTYYSQPLSDFDSVGYELLPLSSVYDNADLYSGDMTKGFGFVPRLSSWKRLHSIRSGGFSQRSLCTSFIPYCLDTIPLIKTSYVSGTSTSSPLTASTKFQYPWAFPKDFFDFNRLFYSSMSGLVLEDNFILQTQFSVTQSSPLKPLSDSYSIEALGHSIVSTEKS